MKNDNENKQINLNVGDGVILSILILIFAFLILSIMGVFGGVLQTISATIFVITIVKVM